MNRREFIKTLIALGASTALPFDIATASDEQVDAIWASGAFDFLVEDYGTISFADFAEPETRGEAYNVTLKELQNPHSLRDFADSSSLNYRLQDVYEDHLGKVPDDPDYGWLTWLETDPEEAHGPIYAAVEKYLDEAPDYCNECEHLPDSANAQGAAYRFFLSEDWDLLDKIGIVIVEGDCPGSSYFAAELRIPVEDANQIASEIGLPYKFRQA